MTPLLPRTDRAIGTAQLPDLAKETATHTFSQHLPVDWLQQHLSTEATHYLIATLPGCC